ncbi:MAG: hypothetical protein ABI693_35115, partial [Bryobacteraceae bacterium]
PMGGLLVRVGQIYAGVESISAVPGRSGLYLIQASVPSTVDFGDDVQIQLQLMDVNGQQLRSNSVTVSLEEGN